MNGWDREALWRRVGAAMGAWLLLGVLLLGIWAVTELVFCQGDRLTPAEYAARRAAVSREFAK